VHLRSRAVQPGIAIIVDADIVPDRVEEFLKLIEEDAKGSREEPGCLRFDVLRASDTRFFFYEAYVDADAVDMHKAQPHFKLWSDFKASGGCTSVSTKATPLGDWGFQ
jgi:quinol monooxygenase YgiN